MYNEDVKSRFLERYPEEKAMRKAYEALFEVISQYEAEWGADICTRNHEELQPVVTQIAGVRMSSAEHRIYMLRDYVKWCIENGVVNACDGALHPFDLGLDKLKQMTVANPKHLQIYLNSVFAPESELTSDCVYRCYFWLAYMGMDEEDIVAVRIGDVDTSEMVVRFKDQDYLLYRESLPAFKACVNQQSFKYDHSRCKDSWLPRADGDLLLRGFRNGTVSHMSLRSVLSRRIKAAVDGGKTVQKLSYFRAWLSGAFYQAYENESCGLPVDFKPIVRRHIEKRHMEGKSYKLDLGRNTEEAKARQLENEYLEDYERWKRAYHNV